MLQFFVLVFFLFLFLLFAFCFAFASFGTLRQQTGRLKGGQRGERANKANSQHLLTFIVALSTPPLALPSPAASLPPCLLLPPPLNVLLSFKLIFSVNDKSFSAELLPGVAGVGGGAAVAGGSCKSVAKEHTQTRTLAHTHSAFCFQLIVYPCQSHVPITQSCLPRRLRLQRSHQRDCHNMNYVSRQHVQECKSPQSNKEDIYL